MYDVEFNLDLSELKIVKKSVIYEVAFNILWIFLEDRFRLK